MEYDRELPRYIYIGDKELELHLSYENVTDSRKKSWLWAAHYKPSDGNPGRYFSEETLQGLQYKVWSWIVKNDIHWDA